MGSTPVAIKITCLPTSITSSSNIYIYSILMGKWKIPVQEILLPQFTSVTGNWRKSLKLISKRTFKSNIVKLWSCKYFLTSSTTYLFIYIFIYYLLLQFFRYPKQYVGSSTNFKNFSIQIIEAIRPNDNEGRCQRVAMTWGRNWQLAFYLQTWNE